MENINRKRLINISYIVLALIAIILILLVLALKGNFFAGDSWEAIALNISTEMLGVFLVFLLLNKVLLGDEASLSDRVEKLVTRLEQQAVRPAATSYFIEPPHYEALIKEAEKVDLIGVALAGTIRANISNILDGLRAGKQYRFVITDPKQAKSINLAGRSRIKDEDYYIDAINGILKEIKRFQQTIKEKNLSGSLEMRLADFAFSYSIRAFDMHQPTGKIFVEIYPHKAPQSPVLELLPEHDGEWYPFFKQQFENIWESSTPFLLEDE